MNFIKRRGIVIDKKNSGKSMLIELFFCNFGIAFIRFFYQQQPCKKDNPAAYEGSGVIF
jgi:hypothetical protein